MTHEGLPDRYYHCIPYDGFHPADISSSDGCAVLKLFICILVPPLHAQSLPPHKSGTSAPSFRLSADVSIGQEYS